MSVPDGTKTHLAHHQQQAARCTLHFYQYTRNHAGHAYNISVRVAQKGWPAGSWHVKLAEHKYIHWIDRQDQKKRSKKNKTRKIVRDLPNKISVSKLLICRLRSTKSSFDFSSVHNGSKLRFKHFVVPFTIPLIHPSPDTQKTEKKNKIQNSTVVTSRTVTLWFTTQNTNSNSWIYAWAQNTTVSVAAPRVCRMEILA